MIKDPIEARRLWKLNLTLIAIFIILPILGFFWGGLDFAKATLVGCAVVAISFYMSQRMLRKVMSGHKAGMSVFISYIAKIAIIVTILFVAVQKYKMDVVGLLFGLSAIFFTTLVSAMTGKTQNSNEN